MDVLVLGGTRFIGRHTVAALLAGGHRVSVFSRGRSPDELPGDVERLHGDRDLGPAGLGALEGRAWDACIDVSGYTAVHVRSSVEALRGRVGRYVFVSTVSVYQDGGPRPVEEDHALLPGVSESVTEVNGETYGPLKVVCERIVRESFGGPWAVLRPQIVAGPYDPTGRYAYWVWRCAENAGLVGVDGGAAMLAPGDGGDHVQVIDVRDVAGFARSVVERGLGGDFNLSGHRLTWVGFLRALGARSAAWVPAERVASLDFMQLPLYRPEFGERAALMDVSNARARSCGLVLNEPAATARDTLEWMVARGLGRPETALSRTREDELTRGIGVVRIG